MVRQRDQRLDDMQRETALLRKQIEDQNYRLNELDVIRGDQQQRLEDLRITNST